MNDRRVDLSNRTAPQPDGLTVCLVGIAFLMALGLGIQKWFLASQYALLLGRFIDEQGWVTRMVVASPRVLAIPLVCIGFGIASLGFRSRKAALLAAIGLLTANILMYAVLFEMQLKLVERNGAMMRDMFQMK